MEGKERKDLEGWRSPCLDSKKRGRGFGGIKGVFGWMEMEGKEGEGFGGR